MAKEQRWLPKLAPLLPLQIPSPLGIGSPSSAYPWHWSVYGWIDGETAAVAPIDDKVGFAETLGQFLVAFHRIDANDGPPPGAHNFYRGGALQTYDRQTRGAIAALGGTIDANTVDRIWQEALASSWRGVPVWVHGDISPGNLLVNHRRLTVVIDFGCLGVGDPACDLSIAWTFFDASSREAFRKSVPLDDATWARARGWALWKALIVSAKLPGTNSAETERAIRTLGEIIADYQIATR